MGKSVVLDDMNDPAYYLICDHHSCYARTLCGSHHTGFGTSWFIGSQVYCPLHIPKKKQVKENGK